ncbi:hypothetical protein QFZ80_000120 [Paenibacillus sp. V4I7]|nr:hypothetical protein [Paenibacillus sp. V4I7]MDQ0913780.1 hypothetical protein [Paenibacillus sp. V4I5]
MYILDEYNKVHQIEDEDIVCLEVSRSDIHYRKKTGADSSKSGCIGEAKLVALPHLCIKRIL